MSFTIDHVVILVEELEPGIADYAALGFTVVPGGEHTGGATHNALIALADGSYLELIAFKQPAPEHTWWRHVAIGPGIIDFALLPDNIEAALATARQRGLPVEGPIPGGRQRPDGQAIAWQLGRPQTPDLPFLCADVTPRELRVPGGAAQQHANGVVGIAGLTVAVADLEASLKRYQALLGTSAPVQVVPAEHAYTASFALGPATITLAAPAAGTPADGPLRTRLETRGEGPYALALAAHREASAQPLDPARTHGAVLTIA